MLCVLITTLGMLSDEVELILIYWLLLNLPSIPLVSISSVFGFIWYEFQCFLRHFIILANLYKIFFMYSVRPIIGLYMTDFIFCNSLLPRPFPFPKVMFVLTAKLNFYIEEW